MKDQKYDQKHLFIYEHSNRIKLLQLYEQNTMLKYEQNTMLILLNFYFILMN